MSLRIDEIARLASLNALVTLCLLTIFRMVLVECSRADLGTYLSMKEYPTQDEKITVDTVTYASINYTYRIFDTQEVHYNEEKARYSEGRVLNVSGYLVHVTDMRDPTNHTGCTPSILPPNRYLGEHTIPWIALIQRGDCTFDDKIKNAYWNRAVGVIIYNNENSMTLEKMKVIDKERNITAVFTYKWIGEEMARIVDRGTQVWVSITEGQRVLKPITNINKTSVLFVSVSFIILMIISLVWLIFYYVQRFRYLQSKDQHSRQLCTVAKRIIGKIPTKSGKSDDKDSENDCCAVCIEPYKATDCIRVLPCKHEFHKNCIDPWLLEHRTCPMCKLDVLKHYGFVVGDPNVKISPTQFVPNVNNPSSQPERSASLSSIVDGAASGSSQVVVHSHHVPHQQQQQYQPPSATTDHMGGGGNSSNSSSSSQISGITVTGSRQVTDV